MGLKTYFINADGTLLECGTQRNGWYDSTGLHIGFRAYMYGSSAKAIDPFLESVGSGVVGISLNAV